MGNNVNVSDFNAFLQQCTWNVISKCFFFFYNKEPGFKPSLVNTNVSIANRPVFERNFSQMVLPESKIYPQNPIVFILRRNEGKSEKVTVL